MAEKKLSNILQHLESDKCINEKECSAMLSPVDTQFNKIEREMAKQEEAKRAAEKERAVNPMAIRPQGVHVTITKEIPAVNVIKKLFGF